MTVATPTPARPNVSVPLFDASAATGSVALRAAAIPQPSVTVPVRVTESPDELRARLLRAASRLQLMLAAGDEPATRWLLRLERPSTSTAMPLPSAALTDDLDAFARRLPDAALRGVEAVVLVAKLAASRERPRRLPIAVAVA